MEIKCGYLLLWLDSSGKMVGLAYGRTRIEFRTKYYNVIYKVSRYQKKKKKKDTSLTFLKTNKNHQGCLVDVF